MLFWKINNKYLFNSFSVDLAVVAGIADVVAFFGFIEHAEGRSIHLLRGVAGRRSCHRSRNPSRRGEARTSRIHQGFYEFFRLAKLLYLVVLITPSLSFNRQLSKTKNRVDCQEA